MTHPVNRQQNILDNIVNQYAVGNLLADNRPNNRNNGAVYTRCDRPSALEPSARATHHAEPGRYPYSATMVTSCFFIGCLIEGIDHDGGCQHLRQHFWRATVRRVDHIQRQPTLPKRIHSVVDIGVKFG